MTQALNLANFANNINTSGQLNGSAVVGTVPNATTAGTANALNPTNTYSVNVLSAQGHYYRQNDLFRRYANADGYLLGTARSHTPNQNQNRTRPDWREISAHQYAGRLVTNCPRHHDEASKNQYRN